MKNGFEDDVPGTVVVDSTDLVSEVLLPDTVLVPDMLVTPVVLSETEADEPLPVDPRDCETDADDSLEPVLVDPLDSVAETDDLELPDTDTLVEDVTDPDGVTLPDGVLTLGVDVEPTVEEDSSQTMSPKTDISTFSATTPLTLVIVITIFEILS